MTIQNKISRRNVLRGLGISLALPWMESLSKASSLGSFSPALETPPLRMGFVFVPNGVHLPDWTPSEEGFGFQLPYILEPLQGVKEDLLVISGLTHDKGRANGDGPGDHARSASVFLTGAQPRKTDGANIRSGVSVDQAAAQAVGQATKFASLELGCERGRGAGNCDSGYSCAYSSNISWASESTPVGKETNPRAVFERLFGGENQKKMDESYVRRQAMKKSVLDFIAEDTRQLQQKLGGNDQQKLDEYLNGVREIERRLEQNEKVSATSSQYEFKGPAGEPQDYREHLRLMADMMVLAFQSDTTRIATYMFANAGSNRNYRNIEVPDGHHDLSHHGGNPEKHAKIRKINRFHVEQLAYMLERLKSIREGEGTLLDNCMIVYGSGLSDGNRHNNENLPVVMAGRARGTITTGRHLRFPEETPMCNLFMSMLDRMGASVDFIGDSTGSLRGLEI
jgi:hypothetical protein